MNTFGLVLDIIGAILLFCGSFYKSRISYKNDTSSLEIAQGRDNWFWIHIEKIGLALLVFGFILQLIYNLTYP